MIFISAFNRIRYIMLCCVLAIGYGGVTSSAQASSSPSSVPEFPGGALEISEEGHRKNHPVIIDIMKKVNGVVTSDDAEWLKGHLQRQLYRAAPGQSSESAFEFFVTAFREQGVREKFSCNGYSCGSSNYWANDVFDIARLYGQDRYQYYFIGELQGQLFSVYTVRRGNGRTYALVDIFSPLHLPEKVAAKRQISNLQTLYLQRPYIKAKAIQSLQQELAQNPELKLVIQAQIVQPASLLQMDNQYKELKRSLNELKLLLGKDGSKTERIRSNIALVRPNTFDKDLPADTLWLQVFRMK